MEHITIIISSFDWEVGKNNDVQTDLFMYKNMHL